ncbi:MAG TPA: BMP family ABC transporter substrate-binding protein [Epulopiscium sp.]|nr:BMP family ABC transporter substrate-binding protein [Candidatus Epulonipiscium sp.]
MKKLLSVLLVTMLVFTMVGCNKKSGYELALITDIGTIDDKSFNQGAWEGVEKYAKEKNVTYKYYQPAEKTTDAYLNTISLAIDGGAKLVVCPGYLFEEAVYKAQDLYADTKFIILDGQPHDADYTDFKINDNVYSIFYAEEQAGFLAGYAAIKDGYTKLGFMGGMAVPAVKRFGYGFVEGAEYGAKELGLSSVDVKYHYTGGFDATPEAKAMATSWFNEGTEVIFACGGAVGNSVMAAAKDTDSKVIGVDVDQSSESETVITSALKMLSISVYDGIAAYYADAFPAGQIVSLSASDDGVGLPMETSKFSTFTQSDYDAIYAELLTGNIKLVRDEDVEDETKIPVEIVKLEAIN